MRTKHHNVTRLLVVSCLVLGLTGLCWAGPPAKNPAMTYGAANDNRPTYDSSTKAADFPGSVAVGDELNTAEVAYTVWEVRDSNDDVVASCVIYCNVITDAAQDCEIRYYLMADTDGTLTLERTDDDTP